MPPTEYLKRIGAAFERRNLTLYLGAGVSVGNGLPTWEQLVLAMYFSAIGNQPMGGWRPFSNYLFAIAEWHLRRGAEPLEITARKIRKYYSDQDEFLEAVRKTLYLGLDESDALDGYSLRFANGTLAAVADLCGDRNGNGGGARSVITYNYDSLLETVLTENTCQAIWRNTVHDPALLPIYHVHGYVPFVGEGSAAAELVFTEDQYHLAAQDPYSWANLVQIQGLSSSVGLMIGLSLSDRNMRRLLDAVRRAPIRTENYALLQRRQWPKPDEHDLDDIQEQALKYLNRFEQSGVKRAVGASRSNYRDQILGILSQVENLDGEQQAFVLEQIGVQPIWYERHDEIPALVKEITGRE